MSRLRLFLSASSLLSVVAWASIALTQEAPDAKPKSRPRTGPGPVDSFNPAPNFNPAPSPSKAPPPFTEPDTSDPNDLGPPQPGEPYGLFSPQDNPPVPLRNRTITRQVRETVVVPMTAEEIKQLRDFRQAKRKLKDAKDDTARKSATDVIQKQLAKAFNDDLTQRETELAAVEERVKLLRKQLERRKVARDEIISLRLKTIVNNAEGLGFPGDEDPTDSSSMFGPIPPNRSSVPMPVEDPNEDPNWDGFRRRKPPIGDQPLTN